MGYCCVTTCRNDSLNSSIANNKITFHRFPRDLDRKGIWIERVGRPNEWMPSRLSVVCSKHFTDKYFIQQRNNKRRLTNTAVPTLFLPSEHDGSIKRIRVRSSQREEKNAKQHENNSFSTCEETQPPSDQLATKIKEYESQICHLTDLVEKGKLKIQSLKQKNRSLLDRISDLEESNVTI